MLFIHFFTFIFPVLPELAANDQLMRFWKSVAKNDVSTSCRLQCLSEKGGGEADKVPMLHQNHTHMHCIVQYWQIRMSRTVIHGIIDLNHCRAFSLVELCTITPCTRFVASFQGHHLVVCIACDFSKVLRVSYTCTYMVIWLSIPLPDFILWLHANFILWFQLLSVSYEQFAVGLDERFGHSLWKDFPEVANRGKRSWSPMRCGVA